MSKRMLPGGQAGKAPKALILLLETHPNKCIEEMDRSFSAGEFIMIANNGETLSMTSMLTKRQLLDWNGYAVMQKNRNMSSLA